MDTMKIGGYIRRLRRSAGLTQKQLAEKLNVSFQAVSKWENGHALPDTGLLLDLCGVLNTTADKLLNGGSILVSERRSMHVEDVIAGFACMEKIGVYFGENSDFFTGMVEGINKKMDVDLLPYLRSSKTREVLWAEVLIQGILSGRTVDMDEVRAEFTNQKMVAQIEKYMKKAAADNAATV